MTDFAEELSDALATIERMRKEADSLQGALESAEADRDTARSGTASAESNLADAQVDQEIAEEESRLLQEELDQIHEGIGLRSIIERSWRADPVATENDLLSAGLGHAVAVIRIDHQQGRLNLVGVQ